MPDETSLWPPELDALTASPEHHRLLLENDAVRVLETIIQPGATTALHTHQYPASTYFVSWSHCVRRGADGEIAMDTRENPTPPKSGQAVWTPALAPHALEVVGEGPLHAITIEIKSLG